MASFLLRSGLVILVLSLFVASAVSLILSRLEWSRKRIALAIPLLFSAGIGFEAWMLYSMFRWSPPELSKEEAETIVRFNEDFRKHGGHQLSRA